MTTKTKTRPKAAEAITAQAITAHVREVIYADHRRAERSVAAVRARMGELGPRLRPAELDADAIAARLLAGEVYDPEVSAATIKQAAEDAAVAKAEHDLLGNVVRQLGFAKFRTTDDHHDAMQAYLADAMTQVVSEAAGLAADHPTTVNLASVMNDPTLVEVAQTQARLTAAYEALRSHQAQAYGGEPGDELRAMVKESGQLRDAFEHEPVWITRRHAVAADRPRMSRLRANGRAHAFEDIPQVPSATGWTHLAWVSLHAEPWIPTLDELERAHNENKVRLDGAPRKWTMLGQEVYDRLTPEARDELMTRGAGD